MVKRLHLAFARWFQVRYNQDTTAAPVGAARSPAIGRFAESENRSGVVCGQAW
jgi:hypothetical protein